ncbi:RNA polymerase sigma factor [Actinophytocola sp.]|uniref:RNA polymerase sigma factor n=1 Tax=Actinophytocola sp. TaxID=1872138 RepID=UPI003899F32D
MTGLEDLLRRLAPQVLAALVRRYRDFEAAEDATQEALLAAATRWPADGVPERPDAWLITVAARKLTDQLRSEQASRRREALSVGPAVDTPDEGDDTLMLLALCCHPSLTPASQIALTLRAVGGLTTAEIARAFLVPEHTMGQRISRAKQKIRASGARFTQPVDLRAVLHVLYLIFTEGYTASSGESLHRAELAREAIRLARLVHALSPTDGEVAGLLALMLLTDARRPARTLPDGSLVPLAEQDRALWDRALVAEGLALVRHALTHARLGVYQVEAAIAAVHTEATSSATTDWRQIVALYRVLSALDPNPVVTLNQAVAVGMAEGAAAGLAALAPLSADVRLAGHHRLHAVRAHLLEMSGAVAEAREEYREAARLTTSVPEQRYLRDRASRLAALPITRSPSQ